MIWVDRFFLLLFFFYHLKFLVPLFWPPLFEEWCCISNGFPLWHFFRFFFFFFLSLVFRSLIIMHISVDSFGFTQFKVHHNLLSFPCGSVVKNLLARQEILVWSLGLENSPVGGHSNPLQYSFLENPVDWGAWKATVHRVTKRLTGLKWLSMYKLLEL